MKTNKKAISLIVLVITIIVLAILAATVIISISNTNIIEQARNAAFKSDLANYKEAYNLYLTSMYADDPNYDKTQLTEADFATIFNGNDYPAELKIVDGELAYETADENEKKTLQELGIAIIAPESGDDGSEEEVALAPGLYEAGTTTLKMSWDELITEGYISVENGVLTAELDLDDEVEGDAPAVSALTGDLVIAEGVTEIGEWAFAACEGLRSIILSNTVTTISDLAFEGCMYLEEINISSSVNSISTNAFNVTWVYINVSEDNTTYASIDGALLSKDCTKLLIVSHITEDTDYTYTIPESVTEIGERAMGGGNTCDLETIYFSGTMDEWNALPKGDNWDECLGCTSEQYVVSCSDGDITVEVSME